MIYWSVGAGAAVFLFLFINQIPTKAAKKNCDFFPISYFKMDVKQADRRKKVP